MTQPTNEQIQRALDDFRRTRQYWMTSKLKACPQQETSDTIETILQNAVAAGGDKRPDCEEMAHAAACLLLPNNGVSDTVWYRHGMTLYEFLASYSGKELTGVVDDDYEILTGDKYPAPPAQPTTGDGE